MALNPLYISTTARGARHNFCANKEWIILLGYIEVFSNFHFGVAVWDATDKLFLWRHTDRIRPANQHQLAHSYSGNIVDILVGSTFAVYTITSLHKMFADDIQLIAGLLKQRQKQ